MAALQSKTKAIGILATKGTLSSHLFHKTSLLYSNDLVVVEQVGNGIVELIEKGGLHSKEMRNLLSTYLAPMIKAKIDFLVLGCTHYHFLTHILKELLPNNVSIIDSGEAVARQTKSILELNKLFNNGAIDGESQFYTNGEHTIIKDFLKSENVRLKKLDF